MKYSSIDANICSSCTCEIHNEASFCGQCGSPIDRKTLALNAIEDVTDLTDLTSTFDKEHRTYFEAPSIDDLAFDFDLEDPVIKNHKWGVALASLSLVALIAVSVVLWTQAQPRTPVVRKEVKVIKVEAPVKPVVVRKALVLPRFEVKKSKKVHRIVIDGKPLFSLHQIKGSRYKTKADRARSITIRLNHCMEKIEKREAVNNVFVAIRNGKTSEVSYRDENGKLFRLLDLSKYDLKRKARKENTPHIQANLIADQLNAIVEAAQPKPVAMLSK